MLDSDGPTFLATKTTGIVHSWGLWGILNDLAPWAVVLSVCMVSEYRRGAAGRTRGQFLLQLLLYCCSHIGMVRVHPFFLALCPSYVDLLRTRNTKPGYIMQ